MFVKICGVTCPEAVEAALREGVDAVGFNFHPPSPRYLSPERASQLAAAVPPTVLRVAVMLRPRQAEWDRVIAAFQPDCVQADADSLADLRLPEGLRKLPVHRDHQKFNAEEFPSDETFLFESAVSGKGRPPNWEHAAVLARRARVLLAGGLDPENVAEAIRRVQPWGVDVSTGVESSAGVKDPARVRAFVRAARGAEYPR